MRTFVLRPVPPYDFAGMIRRFENVSHNLYTIRDGCLIRTIRVGGNIYLMRAASKGGADSPELVIDLQETAPVGDWDPVVRYVEHLLSVNVNLGTFYRHLEHLGVLAPLARQFYGLHIILEPDPFECLVRTVIGQQLNLSFAAELSRRLNAHACEPVIWEGQPYPVFPSAEEVARLSYVELQSLQFSRRKAEYVIDFARDVVNGRLNLDDLVKKDNESIIREIIGLRGIGRWTAECFLLFGLGRPDVLPAADIGLRNAVKHWYGHESQPTEEKIREIGADWAPWSSYITFYLWETLNNLGKQEKTIRVKNKKEIINGEEFGGRSSR